MSSSEGFQGMDVQQGRQTAREMDEHAAEVAEVVAGVTRELEAALWMGPDGDAFRGDWRDVFRGQLDGVVRSLQDNAAQMRTYADRQEQASR
jgi:hypothetical protein